MGNAHVLVRASGAPGGPNQMRQWRERSRDRLLLTRWRRGKCVTGVTEASSSGAV